jgi:hypothetical protein
MIVRNLRAVHAWLLAPAPGRPLLWFRGAVAGFCLARLLIVRDSWLDLYGQYGFIQWAITRGNLYEAYPHLGDLARGLAGAGLSSDHAVFAVIGVYAGALAAMLIGARPRLGASVAWCCNFLLSHASAGLLYGMDYFTHIALTYCVFLPADLGTYERPSPRSVGAGVLRKALQLQLCIVYASSGIEKALGEQWWSGEAIWRALSLPIFKQFELSTLAALPWLPMLVGWSVLAIEGLYPLFMLWRKTRPLWLLAVVGMHLGIGMFMGMWVFASIMIILNLGAFLPDAALPPVTRIGAETAPRIRRLLRRASGRERPAALEPATRGRL